MRVTSSEFSTTTPWSFVGSRPGAVVAGRLSTFLERPLLGGVVVLDARPRHLAHSLVHPDDEAKEDRPAADVGAVTGTLLEKGSRSGLARGKPNDHPAAGSGSLSGHHAIVLLGESKNEP